MKIILPFLAIFAVYLPMRFYFNIKSREFQDPMTRFVSAQPELSLADGIEVIRTAPPEFYSTAMERLLPYFSQHYIVVLAVLAVLLAKELAFRRKEAHRVFMWLTFALLTLAMPVVGRIFFVFKGEGFVETILFPWYFCYPIAGVSIALGLLLRPTPSLEKRIAGSSAVTRIFMLALAAALLVALNFGNAGQIRTSASAIAEENRKFHELVNRYRRSMTSFLQSSSYSSGQEYYFLDDLVGKKEEYPLNWAVTQRDIFHLYFPHAETIQFFNRLTFLGERKPPPEYYIWTAETVIRKPVEN